MLVPFASEFVTGARRWSTNFGSRARRHARCGFDRQLGRHDSSVLVAAISAARAARPADRLMVAADALLVVGRACRRRGARASVVAARHRAVLRGQLRHARRRLHLERHHRSRSRCQGRAHALAADPGRAGQRDAGAGLFGCAGPDRTCGAAAVQPLRGLDRHRLASDRRDLSLHEAHHLVAADRAGTGLLLGRADGICRDLRQARCDGDRALCRIDLPG